MAASTYSERGRTAQSGLDRAAPAAPAATRADRDKVERQASQAPKVEPKAQGKGMMAGIKAKATATKESLEKYAAFRVLESLAEGFTKDKVTTHAAAMTYYGVFSLFPLLLLFMSLAGLAMQSNEAAREQIMGVITGLLPQGQNTLSDVIAGVIKAKGAAAGVGILTLLWGALGWFQVIDTNINEIWGVSKSRSFIKGKLFALAMVAGIGGVAIASFAANAAVGLVQHFTGSVPGSALLWQIVVSALSLLTMAGVFFVLYRFAPQRKIKFADIWPAALLNAVIWEVTRRLLAFYLERNNMVSGYGPIGAAMALLFWIYVASIIILVGAELSYAIAKERRHIGVDTEMEVVSPPGEQPTAKFAPQVGDGQHAAQDKDEPVKPERSTSPQLPAAAGTAGSPRYAGAPTGLMAKPVWMASAAGGATDVQAASEAEAGPRQIHLDVPLVALVSVCVGFVLGWFQKKDELRA